MKHLISSLLLLLLLASVTHAEDDCHLQDGPQICPAGTHLLFAAPGPAQNPEPDPEMCGLCAAPGFIDVLQCTEIAGGHWCDLRYLHPGAHYEYTITNGLGTHPLNATGHSLFVPCANEGQLIVARWTVNGEYFASGQTLAGCLATH